MADRAWKVAYVMAAALGMAAVISMLPWATLTGAGGLFVAPVGDLPTNLIGHLAFQRPGWHWPLLRAPDLAWPAGESVAMTDSNPLLSVVAKLVAATRGHPGNLLGLWLAACMVLQPITAVFALRGFMPAAGNRASVCIAAFAAAMLSLLMPALLFRVIHINLLAHFLLLMALGLAARWCRNDQVPPFGTVFLLLTGAVLIHPYLFLFCAATLCAPAAQYIWAGAERGRASIRVVALASLLSAGLFLLLSGGGASGGPGYGLYSLNLLGPVWPQRSGIFGPSLPELDATGFQQEGFNYLGAGVVLLIAMAIALAVTAETTQRRAAWHRTRGVFATMLLLTALAITPHLTAGHADLLPLQSKIMERLFAVVRASGRAFWVVSYALVLGSIAILATRLRPAIFAGAITIVLILQWIDSAPLRQGARTYFAGTAQSAPNFVIPAGTNLYRTVPACGAAGNADVVADEYRLIALRQGARLADVRLAHPPAEALCARSLTDGLTNVMERGETRLFLPEVAARVQPTALGTGVHCEPMQAGTLCYWAGR
jgi:hypothetical protein